MFKHKTLFIVGAGASAELDLPVGQQLADKIRTMMDVRFERGFEPVGEGDHNLYSHLGHAYPNHRAQLHQAAWRIRDGLGLVAQSIDDFLDQHRTDELVNLYGKAAIVQAIAEAERGSKLAFDMAKGEDTFDDKQLNDTWLRRFMHMLCRGLPRENVRQVFRNTSFIVFNYDRCIEHYLIHALKRGYSLDRGVAAEIVADLNIIHPYGSIGDLRHVPFGATRLNCASLAQDIKTYTEQAGTDLRPTLFEMIDEADHVVFLGFAYYDQNMALLAPMEELSRKHVFGTAYGMSDADVRVVVQQLLQWFRLDARGARHPPDWINIENKLKCAGLFDYYAKSLTA
jgi:hypothetical protein